jgi:hypothetical protein
MRGGSAKAGVVGGVVSFFLLALLTESVWGFAVGVLIGARAGADYVTQEEVSGILRQRGIEAPSQPDANWYERLPSAARKDIQDVIKKKLTDVNWFKVTLAHSAFVFAVAGFVFGFLSRTHVLVGLLVVLSFAVNNPVVRFPHAETLGFQQKLLVVAVQFMVCYLSGYCGSRLAFRWDRRSTRIS